MKRWLWIAVGLGLLASLWYRGVFQPARPRPVTPVKTVINQADEYAFQLLRGLSSTWGTTQHAAPQGAPRGNGQTGDQ